MDEHLNNSYIISVQDIMVLAAGLGFYRIIGFPFETDLLQRNDIINIISDLSKRKIIGASGNKFVIEEKYKKMIKQMGDARLVLCIRSRNEYLPEFCCYPDSDILVSETAEYKSGHFKLSVLSYEAMWDKLLHGGYLPLTANEILIENEEGIQNEETVLLELYKAKKIGLYSQVVFWAEVRRADRNQSVNYIVMEHPLYRYIILDDGVEIKRFPFEPEMAKETFFDLLQMF